MKRQKGTRSTYGHGFGESERSEDGGLEDGLFPCFGSLFQSDQLGVEFALQSHEELLQRSGLLVPEYRLQGHALFPLADKWEGLIIDDYFVISREATGTKPLNTFAWDALVKAREAYDDAGVLGSPEKDVEASTSLKLQEQRSIPAPLQFREVLLQLLLHFQEGLPSLAFHFGLQLCPSSQASFWPDSQAVGHQC